jgi:hypothetical protein
MIVRAVFCSVSLKQKTKALAYFPDVWYNYINEYRRILHSKEMNAMNTEKPRKLPAGIQSFEKLREFGAVYVDKTAYVYKMAHSAGKHFLLYSKSGTRTMPCALQPTLVLCMPLV